MARLTQLGEAALGHLKSVYTPCPPASAKAMAGQQGPSPAPRVPVLGCSLLYPTPEHRPAAHAEARDKVSHCTRGWRSVRRSSCFYNKHS